MSYINTTSGITGPSQLANNSSIGANQRIFSGYLDALTAKPVPARLLLQGASGRGGKSEAFKNLAGQAADNYQKLLGQHVGNDCPTPRV